MRNIIETVIKEMKIDQREANEQDNSNNYSHDYDMINDNLYEWRQKHLNQQEKHLEEE